jgi:hypothetical protein
MITLKELNEKMSRLKNIHIDVFKGITSSGAEIALSTELLESIIKYLNETEEMEFKKNMIKANIYIDQMSKRRE